jgi:hypothetical protein
MITLSNQKILKFRGSIMTQKQLRTHARKYFLNNLKAQSIRDIGRHTGISNGSLQRFLNGKEIKITAEQERKIIIIVAPWELDPVCLAGKAREKMLRQFLTHDEIANFARLIGGTPHSSAS